MSKALYRKQCLLTFLGEVYVQSNLPVAAEPQPVSLKQPGNAWEDFMLASSRLVAFVGTTDSQKARHFYEDVLGLSFVSEDPLGLVFDANSAMLRLSKLDAVTPAPYTVLGWDVADIRAVAHSLHAKGIEFERFPGLEQDDTGVWVSPNGAKVAWFKDPDGNVLSLSQPS